MSEKLEMWRAREGKIFATSEEADGHEREMNVIDTLEGVYFEGMIECASDIINFLVDNKKLILEYYGIEE